MVLQRHGKRPLAVLGRTLLQANNRCVGLPSWSEITIQETSGARFVACLRHTPPCQGDPVWRDAWLCDNADAVRAALRAHDPLQALPPPIPPDCAGSGEAALFARDRFHHHVETALMFRAAWAGLLAAVFGLPGRAPPPRSLLA
jgi:hypothetical protein